jgi:molybdopterin converting factor subunit 1
LENAVTIRYFARLREVVGQTQELWPIQGTTSAGAVYEQLASHYSFPYSLDQLKVAVNGRFAEFSTTIRDGDELAFIPPVAGG